MRAPAASNATLNTPLSWRIGSPIGSPGGRVPQPDCSSPPVAMRVPSGLNATLITVSWRIVGRSAARWPRPTTERSGRRCPGDAGAVRAERHVITPSSWPHQRWPIGCPGSMSHIRTVLSAPAGGDAGAVRAQRPWSTASSWRVASDRLPVTVSHTRQRLLVLPVAMRMPSGLTATRYHPCRDVDDLEHVRASSIERRDQLSVSRIRYVGEDCGAGYQQHLRSQSCRYCPREMARSAQLRVAYTPDGAESAVRATETSSPRPARASRRVMHRQHREDNRPRRNHRQQRRVAPRSPCRRTVRLESSLAIDAPQLPRRLRSPASRGFSAGAVAAPRLHQGHSCAASSSSCAPPIAVFAYDAREHIVCEFDPLRAVAVL